MTPTLPSGLERPRAFLQRTRPLLVESAAERAHRALRIPVSPPGRVARRRRAESAHCADRHVGGRAAGRAAAAARRDRRRARAASGTATRRRSARRSSGAPRSAISSAATRERAARIDPETEISPVTSTREGLYLAASIATSPSRKAPLALMQNPFYQTYRAGAIMAGAEPRYLAHSGFPRFRARSRARSTKRRSSRTSILYLCSPSNPDGRVIGADEMQRAIEAARRHNFLVVFDECYAELYDGAPPRRRARRARGDRLLGALARQRARAAFAVQALERGGAALGIRRRRRETSWPRSIACASTAPRCTPLPLLAAATALWSEDAHVAGDARAALASARTPPTACWAGIPGLLPAAVRVLPVDARRRRPGAHAAPLARLRAARCCRAPISPSPSADGIERGRRLHPDRARPRPRDDAGGAVAARRGARRVAPR